uniref:Uncharacterized protein n=1 Tax=Panagrolaimus superbus TaxID=310955 RepID=A0A914XV18_9BILA
MGNVTLRFTALYYNMANQNSFYFQLSDPESENITNVYINKSGDSVTFHDPIVALYYTSDLVTDEAMFLIETINNTVN